MPAEQDPSARQIAEAQQPSGQLQKELYKLGCFSHSALVSSYVLIGGQEKFLLRPHKRIHDSRISEHIQVFSNRFESEAARITKCSFLTTTLLKFMFYNMLR
ncbi:MAG: hypothetical protein Ct9H90mP25_6090 [Gammaproteobacteria bacterium]|nr:MAG: hypothetical protein Ct9H90mP25_6090 [Gammaproteobacteria bacterium]